MTTACQISTRRGGAHCPLYGEPPRTNILGDERELYKLSTSCMLQNCSRRPKTPQLPHRTARRTRRIDSDETVHVKGTHFAVVTVILIGQSLHIRLGSPELHGRGDGAACHKSYDAVHAIRNLVSSQRAGAAFMAAPTCDIREYV